MTYYRGPFTYSGDVLDHITHPEGIIRKPSGSYIYYYAKAEHTGSTRLLCHAVGNTMVADQTTEYYPYGLSYQNENLNLNRYLYSGKELQDQTINGKLLGLYDFGSRNYDPILGRWFNIDPALQFTNPYLYCGNSPMMYIDENGEWAGIDDLIAMLIGGLVNSVGNLISGDINSVGHFFASFGVGALAGEATLYGGPVAGAAVLGAGNSIINQGFNNGWNNINYASVGFSTAMSVATSVVGSGVSSIVGSQMDKITSGISSPLLKGAVNQGATNAASGFAVGTGVALINGESISDALGQGGRGALNGLAIGATTGGISGLKYAKDNNVSPWNGRNLSLSKELRPTLNRIDRGEKHWHRNDGSVFKNNNLDLPNQELGYYREYVHPTPGIKGAGLQRVIIGAKGEVWYSPDHYKTFIRINK